MPFTELDESPSIRIEPRLITVDVGAVAEFRCIASGNPAPQVYWTKGRETCFRVIVQEFNFSVYLRHHSKIGKKTLFL